MFEGLKLHYLECFGTGRLFVWANAAHAVVDLLRIAQLRNSQAHRVSMTNC